MRNRDVRALPGRFETNASVGGAIAEMITFGWPGDHVRTPKAQIEAQTDDAVRAAAKSSLVPSQMTWVVIGDLRQIEAPIRQLGLGEVQVLDADGTLCATRNKARHAVESLDPGPARHRAAWRLPRHATVAVAGRYCCSTADRGRAQLVAYCVFDEIFVRSFADATTGPLANDGIGDFQGLIEKLDYLNDGDPTTTKDLGVTGIWLMPIMASPSYHGYDVTDYYGVLPGVRHERGLRAASIAEAHRRGIRVIVDLVLNHTSSQHPLVRASRCDGDSGVA